MTENDPQGDERDLLTQRVIGAAIEVHREMGPGLLESVYQKCRAREFSRQGIVCELQARLPLVYKGEVLDDDYFILDVFFPGQLVVELKTVEKLLPIHEAQLLTYLRLSKTRVGLLINFNVRLLKDGIKRMVL
jgi:GxxExxY protein